MRWLTWRGVNAITRSSPAGAVMVRSSGESTRPGVNDHQGLNVKILWSPLHGIGASNGCGSPRMNP